MITGYVTEYCNLIVFRYTLQAGLFYDRQKVVWEWVSVSWWTNAGVSRAVLLAKCVDTDSGGDSMFVWCETTITRKGKPYSSSIVWLHKQIAIATCFVREELNLCLLATKAEYLYKGMITDS